MTPDGIISSLAGPMCAMNRLSSSSTRCQVHVSMIFSDSCELVNIGDLAYCGSLVTIGAYRRPQHGRLPATETLFNYDISQNRISVEHGFAILSNKWMKLGLHQTRRIRSSPVAAYFGAAVLLTNVWTCLYGNQVSRRFKIAPPTLEEYLG
jgi:DDE superfamily endonuclease